LCKTSRTTRMFVSARYIVEKENEKVFKEARRLYKRKERKSAIASINGNDLEDIRSHSKERAANMEGKGENWSIRFREIGGGERGLRCKLRVRSGWKRDRVLTFVQQLKRQTGRGRGNRRE